MNLGELQYVSIKEIWKTESVDFTPWLAKNLSVLAKELRLEMELIKTEQEVGDFYLDIFAKHPDGTPVVIENQFGDSDHKHLGQLLTYASGQEAKTVIWICERFREEHQKAIDWLNENSHEDIRFFAVEIALISTDGLTAAPLFKVLASPNEWFKKQKTKTMGAQEFSPTAKRKNEFYNQLLAEIQLRKPELTTRTTTQDKDYMDFNSGKSGYRYWIQFRGGKLSCQLVFNETNKDQAQEINKRRFDAMKLHEPVLSKLIPSLSWERLDEKKQSKIVSYCPFSDEEEMINWAIEMLSQFKTTFQTFLNP